MNIDGTEETAPQTPAQRLANLGWHKDGKNIYLSHTTYSRESAHALVKSLGQEAVAATGLAYRNYGNGTKIELNAQKADKFFSQHGLTAQLMDVEPTPGGNATRTRFRGGNSGQQR